MGVTPRDEWVVLLHAPPYETAELACRLLTSAKVPCMVSVRSSEQSAATRTSAIPAYPDILVPADQAERCRAMLAREFGVEAARDLWPDDDRRTP